MLLLNTAIGTVLMAAGGAFMMVFPFLFYGTLFGVAVSFPAPFLLYFLFDRCVAHKVPARWMLRIALAGAICCGIVAWLLFLAFFGDMGELSSFFLVLGTVSGVFATLMQRSNIRRLAGVSRTVEQPLY